MSKAAMLRFEHKLSVARVNDQKMEDLTKYLDRDKTLKENFKSDDRADMPPQAADMTDRTQRCGKIASQ